MSRPRPAADVCRSDPAYLSFRSEEVQSLPSWSEPSSCLRVASSQAVLSVRFDLSFNPLQVCKEMAARSVTVIHAGRRVPVRLYNGDAEGGRVTYFEFFATLFSLCDVWAPPLYVASTRAKLALPDDEDLPVNLAANESVLYTLPPALSLAAPNIILVKQPIALSQPSELQKVKQFLARVIDYARRTVEYESPEAQDAARAVMSLDVLKSKAQARLKESSDDPPSDRSPDQIATGDNRQETKAEFQCPEAALCRELLVWFKDSFFKWFNIPDCWGCGQGAKVELLGLSQPSPEELQNLASRVEKYGCRSCGASMRFPRYNRAVKLLQTRKGRCGEWAQAFTLCARAAGLDARMVYDWTDHVWTEIYSNRLGRWLHADSCENALDEPLLYSKGWGKNLTYCFAVSPYGAVDVTPRYVPTWDTKLLARRTDISEGAVHGVEVQASLSLLDAHARLLSPEARTWAELRLIHEFEQNEAVKACSFVSSDIPGYLPGRQSGSAEWIQSRGEGGPPQ
ncbi:Peptide-N(4)-(N-acetyl-beta-glucosaminyl)asparagine amidase [Porphyridium purpureum]|uniref:Peptide-N(4)-(N-acetyl-beta-glucosaminyl)asparagine amidase n=1 Tax=Porphyridium purpureum TaxID=35688 RepID=A0A5J4Z3A6_PORPP|nr:Peptide-N(4)-(N-acetyl-beta-glucosaminyl)asparagine amidase [Porphyridium purpureum]|eukprot:POR8642..scf295_1